MRFGMVALGLLVALTTSAGADSSSLRLLLAPMIEGVRLCQAAIGRDDLRSLDAAEAYCGDTHHDAGTLVGAALDAIGPKNSPDGRYALGYTYVLPLLSLFKRVDQEWVVDRERIRHDLATVQAIDRPVVLYLFSTHFGTGPKGSDLEQELAAEPHALLSSQNGPMKPDTYFSGTVFPWNFTDPSVRINTLRHRAFDAVLDEVCHLDPTTRDRIAAVTILGEVHHFFPNFFAGAAYTSPYLLTDYGPSSRTGFREFLRHRFSAVEEMNFALGTTFASFDAVEPPSKDIKTQTLSNFSEHIDQFAAGNVPIFGWAHDTKGPVTIAIFLNGTEIATVPADLNRLDVLQAKPAFGTPNVGFRYDLDYAMLPPGKHKLAVFALSGGTATRLAERTLVVMDRRQSEPRELPSVPLPQAGELRPGGTLEAYVDQPADLTPLFYNPLARLWNEFRNAQVHDYLADFGRAARRSCLGPDKVYSQEIAPRFNPTWNPDILAVDAALHPTSAYHLGVNLYGGITYGDAFFRWLAAEGFTAYGVPEFHPMTPLPQDQMIAMLERHREAGARFISPYFVSIVPKALQTASDHNKFQLSAGNPDYGSGLLLQALHTVMTRGAP